MGNAPESRAWRRTRRPVCRRRSDPHYRRLWLGDWQAVFRSNLIAADCGVRLIVLTAPGADVLPWDRERCTHEPDESCSGMKGCSVVGEAASMWNWAMPAQWSKLHRKAAQNTRRRFGRFSLLAQAVEPQRRGVYHWNLVVGYESVRQKAASGFYVSELERLAATHHFGYVDRRRRVMTAHHAAHYIAKYFTEKGGKLGIGDTAARGDCPRTVARVARELTTATGITMRQRRRVRYRWVLAQLLHDGDIARAGLHLAVMRLHHPRVRQQRRRARSALDDPDAELHAWHRLVVSLALAGLQPEPLDGWLPGEAGT